MQDEEWVTDADTAGDTPRVVVPVTDDLETYWLLGQLALNRDYDEENAFRVLEALWPKHRRRAVKWHDDYLVLKVARARNGWRVYQAFHRNGRCLCRIEVSDLVDGIAVIEKIAMRWKAEPADVAAVMLNAIRGDLARVKARLLPTPPHVMSDEEFLAWWSFENDDVLYYPHRERLGLELTAKEAEELDFMRHALGAVLMRAREKARATGKTAGEGKTSDVLVAIEADEDQGDDGGRQQRE